MGKPLIDICAGRLWAAMACAALLCVAVAAEAGVGELDARKHFQEGNRFTHLNDYASAAAEFEKSFALVPTRAALFNLAECYFALHRYRDARDAYDKLQREFGDQLSETMRATATRRLDELVALLGTVRLEIAPDGASVYLDQDLVGASPLTEDLIVAPGEHNLRVEAEGHVTLNRTFQIAAGEKLRMDLALMPEGEIDEGALTKADRYTRWMAASAVATGVAGVTAGVFWALWATTHNDFETEDGNLADLTRSSDDFIEQWEKVEDLGDQAARYGNLAIATGVVTGVFAATTAVFGVLRHRERRKDTAAKGPVVGVGPGVFYVEF